MTTMSFPSVPAGSLVLILGLGETGVAAALWCADRGARLRVLDTREQPGAWPALREQLGEAAAECRFGAAALVEDALLDVSMVVLSPGLSPRDEPVRSFLALVAERGIEVLGEIELFARALSDMAEQGYQPKVLAVTGTNGKTTVTAMARQLCEAGGLKARAAGNISPAALTALREALAADDLPEVWVLELSSFQLDATHTLAADAAAVLNISQDHLDWHGSMNAYAAAKARLVKMAKVVVINRDDPVVAAMVADVKAQSVRSFGRDVPVIEGDLGIESSHEVRWLAVAEALDFDVPAAKPKRKKNDAEPPRETGRMTRLIPVDALRVRGTHNALNALAALALVRCLGLAWAGILPALRDYRGEPHRVEFVRSIGGVAFVEDSKGTNVGATVAALDGLGQTVVLIAGGLGKGQDFSPLVKVVREHTRAVVLIGQDGPLIAQTLASCGVPLEQAESMEQAVARGFALAREGDAVLLSPACASMDMFKNYGDRARVFVEAVQALALEQGELT
ncbi:UDP-N-acetylmuramoyl-L-alanine--D-glutamate ligase [Paralcaligenes sp. KSB-10]|uniref:UDP-N-acetylmuramoyl-L-alanine--D-glutamate ligase n=1 Tax=Paralcaligenes sp. KSB-10 TaxID=2901142 RepID=UPI001E32708B|nr:UDP-N-acetylmuramoyl-L-alanine--D-glutamate ligase [Paralcaligenes sp. KSB-10]UHL65822.1 UDP-N-acetylmuramoyl-L-alanine--D-glutamate ligase [Paralcaligenes sp. KSB-10]